MTIHGAGRRFRQAFGAVRALGGLWRSRKGVATTEFALTAPIFVVMGLGVIDVGNALVNKFDLHAMARIGAEYALANSTDAAAVKAVVLSAAKRDNSQLSVETTVFCECQYQQVDTCETTCPTEDTLRKYVKVSVSEFYSPLFLPNPEHPETANYTVFQQITHLSADVTLRLE